MSAPAGRGRPRYLSFTSRDGEQHWRLLLGNNRPVGRSVEGFATAAEVCADVDELRRTAATASVTLLSVRGGEWRWDMADGDVPVALSWRAYGRRLECLAASERFRVAAACAEPLVLPDSPRLFPGCDLPAPRRGQDVGRTSGVHVAEPVRPPGADVLPGRGPIGSAPPVQEDS